jgi:hypothetical protein
MPVIPGTPQAEVEGKWLQASPGKISMRPYQTKTTSSRKKKLAT